MDAMTAWTTIMGSRTPGDVVREFDLRASRRELDQWLGEAESEACIQAPERDEDGLLGRESLAATLAPHHQRFLDDLEIAAREAAELAPEPKGSPDEGREGHVALWGAPQPLQELALCGNCEKRSGELTDGAVETEDGARVCRACQEPPERSAGR